MLVTTGNTDAREQLLMLDGARLPSATTCSDPLNRTVESFSPRGEIFHLSAPRQLFLVQALTNVVVVDRKYNTN